MSAPTELELYVSSTILIVLGFIYVLVRYSWNRPLRNGPSYFLGIEVPGLFYEGRGRGWLQSYHAVLVVLHLVLAGGLAVILSMGRWDLTPAWAGCSAIVYTITMVTFEGWTRRSLGAHPPVRPVAVALQSRRLGDYISWPLETLMVAIVAVSWWLLLRHGETQVNWLTPSLLTWSALVLPGKIAIVHSSFPLPVERTEEHYRYQDAMRRNAVDVLNAWGWFSVIILCGLALAHGLFAGGIAPLLQWLLLGAALAVWGMQMMLIFRGMRLATTLGRDLLPAGSWSTQFRRGMGISRPYLVWFAVWISVLVIFSLNSLR